MADKAMTHTEWFKRHGGWSASLGGMLHEPEQTKMGPKTETTYLGRHLHENLGLAQLQGMVFDAQAAIDRMKPFLEQWNQPEFQRHMPVMRAEMIEGMQMLAGAMMQMAGHSWVRPGLSDQLRRSSTKLSADVSGLSNDALAQHALPLMAPLLAIESMMPGRGL